MRLFGIAAISVILAGSATAHGAAALAAGAKTSAKPTAADPVKRQIQISADPVGILDFQFSLTYDPNILRVARFPDTGEFGDLAGQPKIAPDNGYVLGLRDGATAPAYSIDDELGVVTVRGYWPQGTTQVPSDEIDVFKVVFELKAFDNEGQSIPLDKTFHIDAQGLTGFENAFDPSSPDFMLSGEIVNGVPVYDRTYTAGDPENPILFATTGSITVPEPGSAGLLGASFLAIGLRRRR